jgi:hypothetical protein
MLRDLRNSNKANSYLLSKWIFLAVVRIIMFQILGFTLYVGQLGQGMRHSKVTVSHWSQPTFL